MGNSGKKEKSLDRAEVDFVRSLRPKSFSEMIGREKEIKNLQIMISAAKKRREALDHILFYGPPGLGKTTFANIVANEFGVDIFSTSGPAIEKQGDLVSILTNIPKGGVLFIDEIHRLHRSIEEVLYPAMEDRVVDIVIGKGPSAKTLRLDLEDFSIIGATTRIGLLTSPLRSRFGANYRLDFYNLNDLRDMVMRNASVLEVSINKAGAVEIAKRSRGTARNAIQYLKRVRDYIQVQELESITDEVVIKVLEMYDVDEVGLDYIDRKILRIIINDFAGGPVGLSTIAAAISEDVSTISDVYEPYLIQSGFIKRTPRGRVVTEKAYKHFGIEVPKDNVSQQKKLGLK